MTADSDDRARADARVNVLEPLANLIAIVSAFFSVVNLVKGGRLPLTITALILVGVAVALGIAILVLLRSRGLQVRVRRAAAFGLVVALAGVLAGTAWLVEPENTKPAATEAGPSPSGGGSTQPVPVTTTPTTTPIADPPKPGCQRLETTAPIRQAAKASTTSVRLTEATYTLYPTDFPGLAEAGRVDGRPAAGDILYLIGTADPSTRDSTPERNRATSGYFLIEPIKPDPQGCWTVERRQVGYDCAGGVTFWHSLALMHAADAQRLVQRQKDDSDLRDNGFPEDEFKKLPVSLLQTFDIDTTPAACSQP